MAFELVFDDKGNAGSNGGYDGVQACSRKVGVRWGVKNSPFPEPLHVSHLTVATWSTDVNAVLQPNQSFLFSLQLPVAILTTLPHISLSIDEFPKEPIVLSPSFAILHCPRVCVDCFSFSQFRVVREEKEPVVVTPLEETCIAGCVNTLEYEVKKKEGKVSVKMEEALEGCYHVKEDWDSICIRLDLTDSKWLDETKDRFEMVIEVTSRKEVLFHRVVLLKIVKPLSITPHILSNNSNSDTEAITVFGGISFGIDCHITSLMDSITVKSSDLIGLHTVLKIWDEPSGKGIVLSSGQETTIHFDLSLPPGWNGLIIMGVLFELWACLPRLISRNNRLISSVSIELPKIRFISPPVTVVMRWPAPVVKNVPQDVAIVLTNQTDREQKVQVQVQRGGSQWVVGGVLECEEMVLARSTVEKRIVVVPLQGGQMRFKGVTVRLPELACDMPLKEEQMEVFVQDCLCSCVC